MIIWITIFVIVVAWLIAKNDAKTDAFLKPDPMAWVELVVGLVGGFLLLTGYVSFPDQLSGVLVAVSAALVAFGLLSVLPRKVRKLITSQDNIGWITIVIGAIVMVAYSIVPAWTVIWPAIVSIWNGFNIWWLVPFLAAVILIILGVLNVRRRNNS